MNILKKSGLFLLLICLSNLLLGQTPIYVEIGDCVKELHYQHSETDGTNYEYYDYHFALNDYETVIFQVSKNTFKDVSEYEMTNMDLVACNSDNLTSQFSVEAVRQIQKRKQDVLLVKKTANGYAVGKVMDAVYMVYLSDGNYLRVIAQSHAFDYDGSQTYNPGAELKTEGEGNFILFDEKEEYCYEKPTFMHVPVNFMETSNMDYVLGVGMVRQYSDEKETKLTMVDGQPIDAYLATFCGETVEPIAQNPVAETVIEEAPFGEIALGETPTGEIMIEETTEEKIVIEETAIVLNVPPMEEEIDMSLIDESSAVLIENSEVETKGGEMIRPLKSIPVMRDTKTEVKAENIHVVEKGETLYSISKKYKISTLELKELNDLKENSIKLGQKLIIKK